VKYFTAIGRFWLPHDPARVIPGTLSFDEDGIQLQLDGSLYPPAAPKNGVIISSPEWATEPTVHGQLRHPYGDVTLLRVSGVSMPGLSGETWSAAFALSGGLIATDSFSQLTVVLDYLMPWTRPPAILRSSLTDPLVTLDTERHELATARLGDGTTVRLITGVDEHLEDTAAHLDQWCAFEVTGVPRSLLEILDEWIRPLQDLLVVCIGRSVRIEQILVRPPVEDSRKPALDVAFKAVQSPPRESLPHLDSYSARTLLTYKTLPLPFATFIKEWFRLYTRFPDAITQLCGPYYAPFIYTRHWYGSTFQSAEAIAKATGETREQPRKEHRRRVKAVLTALERAKLDSEVVDWVGRLIRRNDRPLAQLIEELITSTGSVGKQMLAAVPDLAGLAVATRTHVSHPAVKGPDVLIQQRLSQVLTWVIRLRLLSELGIPVTTLATAASTKPSFQHDLQELAALQTTPSKATRPQRISAATRSPKFNRLKQLLRKRMGDS
jgi:ApeA N-terminal domain 1/Apea-like HEPN